ncbi:MAG: DUF402 domain-containing protein [Bacilli bacterium]|nr:DUF402 domain-containing protein [Bacilli bacterium]
MKYEIGTNFNIQCYKHNEKVNRAWNEAVLLETHDEYQAFGNNKTIVTEADGSSWKTKEPAIIYFFDNEWFNIIAQLKKDGIYYYCNIATPYIIEDNTIKYIDYDLDLRIFPNGEFKVLDESEYKYHKKLMGYTEELDKVINGALKELIEKYNNKFFPFNKEENTRLHNIYKDIKES